MTFNYFPPKNIGLIQGQGCFLVLERVQNKNTILSKYTNPPPLSYLCHIPASIHTIKWVFPK